MKEKNNSYFIKAGVVAVAAIFLASILSPSGVGLTKMENNDRTYLTTIKAIEEIGFCPNGEHLGGWIVAAEYTNPWPFSNTWKSHSSCTAVMNADTGEGNFYAVTIPNAQTYAGVGIGLSPEGYGIPWIGPDCDGLLVLKAPSYIEGHMVNWGGAHAGVYIYIEEWYGGQKVNDYIDTICSWNLYGSFSADLDNLGIEFDLHTNHIYVVRISTSGFAYSGPIPTQGSNVHVNLVKFKKVWLCYDSGGDYNIMATRPKAGKLYFRNIEFPPNFPWPFSILVFCPSIFHVEAYDGGTGVNSVKFSTQGDSCWDYTSSDGYFSGDLHFTSGFRIFLVEAYDGNNIKVAQDTLMVLRFGTG